MKCQPNEILEIYPHKRHNSWLGMELEIYEEEEQVKRPTDLTDCQIKAQFKLKKDGPVAFEFTTANGSIILTDAENGMIEFAERDIDVPAGVYQSDLFVIYPDGLKVTYCGIVFPIVNVISK